MKRGKTYWIFKKYIWLSVFPSGNYGEYDLNYMFRFFCFLFHFAKNEKTKEKSFKINFI